MKQCFAPIFAPDARVLICGSLPGEASLLAQRYYAHPRNQFWQLVGSIIDQPLAEMEYDRRIEALIAHRIALWDTVAQARRVGSLDTAIREVTASPLDALVAQLPDLRMVAFNGQRAAQIGKRQLAADWQARYLVLPSSSPAHAARTLADKTQAWAALRPLIAD